MYLEAKEQFDRNVLGAMLPNGLKAYYNGNILGKLFHAPGQKTERAPLRTITKRKKVRVTKKLTKEVLATKGTQKEIAEKFGLTVAQVSQIQRENRK